MDFPPAPLEVWLRDHYFTAEINICSSGVQPYSVHELRELTGTTVAEMDDLVLDDGYSYGDPVVRQALAQRWGDGDASRVMTTCGSNEALSLILGALLRPADEVIVVEPGYHSLIGFARTSGCHTKTWGLHFDQGFRPDLAELEQLVTPATRAIIVNFPHNPTGASIGQDEMKTLLNVADRHGVYVLWDTAFTDIVYDMPSLPNPATLYERAITVGTMSKSYGLPGLRFGWCVAPPELLAHCVRTRDYTTLHVSPLVELLALRAIEHADALIGPRFEQARTNREIVRRWSDDHADQVTMILPVGGVASFPRLDDFENTEAFAQLLLDEYGVLVIPGSCFGHPQHIRLGFGGSTTELVEALDRFDHALKRERSGHPQT